MIINPFIRNLFFLISFLFIISTSDKNYIFSDTIPYIEMTKLILSSQFYDAINPYWSPLYSLILSFFSLVLFQIQDTFLIIQIASIFIYIFQTFCFHFFLTIFLKYNALNSNNYLSNKQLYIFGFLIYLICCHLCIPSSYKTPDTLVASFVFLTFALVLKIINENEKNLNYLSLSLVLSLGYFSKSYFFVVSLFIFFLFFLLSFVDRKYLTKIIFTTIVFSIICIPFILTISIKNGSFTIGNSGTYNLYENINYNKEPFPFSNDWLKHSSENNNSKLQIIYKEPQIIKINYTGNIKPTYPIWFDPTYFYNTNEIDLRIKIRNIVPKFLSNSKDTFYYLKATLGQFFFAEIIEVNIKQFLFLYLISIIFLFFKINKKVSVSKYTPEIFLILVCVFALTVFTIARVQPRYIYPFIIILSFVSVMHLPLNYLFKQNFSISSIVVHLIFIINLYAFIVIIYGNFNTANSIVDYSDISSKINRLDLKKETNVAVVGSGTTFQKVAFLSNLKISHLISPSNSKEFNLINNHDFSKIIDILKKENINYIFYFTRYEFSTKDQFEKIKDSDFFYFKIN